MLNPQSTSNSNATIQSAISQISNQTKPLSVTVIENMGKLRPFRHLHWSILCIIITLVCSIVGLPWVIIGINEGPGQPYSYVLGYITVASVLVIALTATFRFYGIFLEWTPLAIKYLGLDGTGQNILTWLDRFSTKRQFYTVVSTGAFLMVTVGITAIITDKSNPITLTSAMLGGYIAGLATGSGVHFLIHTTSFARFLLANKSDGYALNPSETIGLRLLSRITIQMTQLGAIAGTITLSFLLVYITTATSGFLSLRFFPALALALFIWSVEWYALSQTFNAISKYIEAQKYRTLANLQNLLNSKYDTVDKSDADYFTRFEKLLQLYNDIKGSANLPLELSSLGRVAVGFLVPLIPTIIDRLLK